ncbi:uncharacterized protein LOC110854775 [Folsomia candida]|uniref:uncharacterized protein LOC110854775 n=1 Tax=Folsomia candida TaxID=158441 RepID=UPI000B902C50|nr:uncharacterized protein LOC110854775 [Folsomia candida]
MTPTLIQNSQSTHRIHTIPNKSSVINLSSRKITPQEEKILKLGLNYAIPTKHHQQSLVEAGINIELCLKDFDVTEHVKNKIRSDIAAIIKSERNKEDPKRKNYAWISQQTKSIKSDPSIVICPADKGNATVILNKVDYNSKIETLLCDPIYETLSGDRTSALSNELKDTWKSLLKLKRI